MKIVVTGAAGFIGRHVIPLLIAKGHEVTAMVRKNQDNFAINQCYRIVEHEIGQEIGNLYSKLGEPDTLLHLAWAEVSNCKSLKHIDIELPTHYNFIKQMVNAGVGNICVTGTCYEYGMQSGMLSEYNEAKPCNPYGYAKDALRKQLQYLKYEHDFKLTWMRPFYMYGEDQPNNTIYSQLRLAVQRRDTVFNMSGGEQLRDYLHIDDVVTKIAELVYIRKDIGIINICSGSPISVRCLVEQWINDRKWDIELNLGHYTYPNYEPLAFWGNTEKYNHILTIGIK